MRLYEFTYKNITNDPRPNNFNLEDVMTKIKINCSQYLNAVTQEGQLLWHGSNNFHQNGSLQSVVETSSRNDRKPQLTDLSTSNKIDELLSISGFKALRSNSTFTTSSLRTAGSYGHPYMIFPWDGFSFTWSDKLRDLTTDMNVSRYDVDSFTKVITDKNNPLYDGEQINYWTYKTTQQSLEDLKLTSEEFIATYKFYDENLQAAIHSGNEVMINGNYLMVSIRHTIEIYQALGLEIDINIINFITTAGVEVEVVK